MNTRLLRRTVKGVLLATAVSLLMLSGCNQGVDAVSGATPRKPRPVIATENYTLELTGVGLGRPAAYSFEQLSQMEVIRLDNVLMQKSHGPDEMTSWRGPALETLLKAAEIKPGPMYLTLEAMDGYKLRCTRLELDSAIIALQDGQGRRLSQLDNTTPLRLVPPKLTGNYWISNLVRIIVEPVGDIEGLP
ncbi:MAG: molybdopterin-dependent oxidoreductase [Phycisphaerae bacterium]|nr:molybdopterin-dependent oxidoreductase [Phycisphaerae bacterium]